MRIDNVAFLVRKIPLGRCGAHLETEVTCVFVSILVVRCTGMCVSILGYDPFDPRTTVDFLAPLNLSFAGKTILRAPKLWRESFIVGCQLFFYLLRRWSKNTCSEGFIWHFDAHEGVSINDDAGFLASCFFVFCGFAAHFRLYLTL